jgi:hypothetical protein
LKISKHNKGSYQSKIRQAFSYKTTDITLATILSSVGTSVSKHEPESLISQSHLQNTGFFNSHICNKKNKKKQKIKTNRETTDLPQVTDKLYHIMLYTPHRINLLQQSNIFFKLTIARLSLLVCIKTINI